MMGQCCLRRIGVALPLIGWLLILSCRPPAQESGRIVTDDLGQQVRIPKEVKKVVSLLPANSEMVCLLDCRRLKGGTRYDRFPQELVKRVANGDIEIVGGGFDPSLEKIAEIDPDLILANGPTQERVVFSLRRMGYAVVSLYPRDGEAMKRDFLLLGEILDQEIKAKKMIEDVERGLERARAKLHDRPRKKVYVQTWSDPILTVGKNSFPQWLITLAGGSNVFEDLPFDSGKVSVESIIERDPQVLIFLSPQEKFAERILHLREWREIAGVRDKHICLMDGDYLRRTIQFLDGVEQIHRCLFDAAGAQR